MFVHKLNKGLKSKDVKLGIFFSVDLNVQSCYIGHLTTLKISKKILNNVNKWKKNFMIDKVDQNID